MALLILLTSPSDHGTTIIPLLVSQSLVYARIVLKSQFPLTKCQDHDDFHVLYQKLVVKCLYEVIALLIFLHVTAPFFLNL